MSFDAVRMWLEQHAPDVRIIEAHGSTATVPDAAATLGVLPGQIVKTLSVRVGDHTFLLCTRGDARLDNQKCKAEFGGRPRMLGLEETLDLTGHEVGGVCPFGLATPLTVYCDVSLRQFETVFPAAGSRTTSVELSLERLFELVGARWVDACRPPGSGGA